MSDIRKFSCNEFAENCYVMGDGGSTAVIIDPGCTPGEECDAVCKYIDSHGLKPAAILLTHAHFDHVYGVKTLQDKYAIPVYMSALCGSWVVYNETFPLRFGMSAPDMSFSYKGISDGDVLNFGELTFKVISTPGHSAGSVCFYEEKREVLFTGDTLFAGAIGRTDVPEGNYDEEIVSIMEKLIFLPGSVDIYPGHGHPSNIARERIGNPFLEPFNEPEEMEYQQ